MAGENGARLKLLVVDDDLDVLGLFRTLVGPLGYDILSLTDSREAAQRVATDTFDMIALDVYLPELNGFELTTRIRASAPNRDVPILMFTGYDDIETMRKGFDVGITHYLAKPLSTSKVRDLFAAARSTKLCERRHCLRLPMRMEVDCRSLGRRFKIWSINLAQGGILLEGANTLTYGDVAHLEFSLPETGQLLKLAARVVRKIEPDFVALEFVDPGPLERATLQNYFASKVRD